MSELVPGTQQSMAPLDALTALLQELRIQAGGPSYAQIANRIARQRRADGVLDAAARLGKSTVFDAFQTGRRRLNAELVVEIVRALGADEREAAVWGERCARAQQPAERTSPLLEVVLTPEAAELVTPGKMQSHRNALSGRLASPQLVVACVLLNLFGGWLVMVIRLPLFLDMVGTAIASVVLGPWPGVLVAVMTNGGETIYDGPASLSFMIVNVAGALVWGIGVRRFAMGRTLPRYLLLNAVVGAVCTLVSVPILVMNFQGETRNASSGITQHLLYTYHSMVAAVFSSNILLSMLDKFISGFGALIAASLVPAVLASRLPDTWQLSLPRVYDGARLNLDPPVN